MSHEPECLLPDFENERWVCICEQVRAAYRRGYNDHARSRAFAEAVYGPFTTGESIIKSMVGGWNQHGEGENP